MKKTIALTGSSGTMGFAGFQELYRRKDQFYITLLLRDSKKNREKFAPYLDDPAVRIVWDDLTDYDDVLELITRAVITTADKLPIYERRAPTGRSS